MMKFPAFQLAVPGQAPVIECLLYILEERFFLGRLTKTFLLSRDCGGVRGLVVSTVSERGPGGASELSVLCAGKICFRLSISVG